MGQSKARAERMAMEMLNSAALTLPPRDLSSNTFWTAIKRPRMVAAPMVRHTDLPSRMQLRKHGAQLAYTSMIDSDKFVAAKPSERKKFFTTVAADRPLIAQFGATNADDFVAAARILEASVDAVCLNMDCPQRRAAEQGFGAFLMRDNAEEVFRIVNRASTELKVPVVAKIRLLSLMPPTGDNNYKCVPHVSKTIEFCKQLEASGCSMVAIHGRTTDMSNSGSSCRDNKEHRPVHRANYEAIDAIQKQLTIPVVANGDITSMTEFEKCLSQSGADAAMVATELIYNPRLFSMPSNSVRRTITPVQQLCFAAEYQFMASIYPGCTPDTLKSHLVDSVIVPCLSPESKREMIPFGDGVETREHAERRLMEIAVLLSMVCGGKDECIALGEVQGGLGGTMEILKEAGQCVRWLGAEGGGALDERTGKVTELFERGIAWMKEFRGGRKGPRRKLGEVRSGDEKRGKKRKAEEKIEEDAKKKKKMMIKAARKALKKSEGGQMRLSELAAAVLEQLGGNGSAKKIKKTLKEAIPADKKKRVQLEGKLAILKS